MLDEPDVSYQHFSALIKSLSAVDNQKDSERVTAIRQMGICLWILFSWGREGGNMESAYRSGELTLLHAWQIARQYAGKPSDASRAISAAFHSIITAQRQISTQYLEKVILPHIGVRHGLTAAVRGSNGLDVNLKLFDLLGRLAMEGLWTYWTASRLPEDQVELKKNLTLAYREMGQSLKALIVNNPNLLLPAKDDQVIDISLAVLLLATDNRNSADLETWLTEIANRARFAYQTHGHYPCTLNSYNQLLEHPKSGDDAYRQNVTQGSVLYPMLSLYGVLFGFDELHKLISEFKTEKLEHCNFQFWYPDDASEQHFYTDSDSHGAILNDVAVTQPKDELLKQVFDECEHSPQFQTLSAVAYGFWPLILVACRHYRLPVPLHLFQGLQEQPQPAQSDKEAPKSAAG